MTPFYPEDSLILAPLAGYTDPPYRMSARRHGCLFAFTEMIDAGSVVFGNAASLRSMERGDAEPWLGIQLVGADPDEMEKAVAIVSRRDYDVIDFNLGCPAPKIAKKGEGAALAVKNPDGALRVFERIVRRSPFPVTAKFRVFHDSDPAPTVAFARRLEEAGARALTIHGRTPEAFYTGSVSHGIIRAAAEAVKIQIVANGGVRDLESYRKLREETSCPAVMLAQGAMGNPWLFTEIAEGENFTPPSATELADEMENHVLEMIDFYGESLAMRVARKVILDYLRGRGFPGTLRSSVSFLSTRDDFASFMTEVRKGPSPRYWKSLESVSLPRRLRPE
jgi:tRNA-dihydrouridine synthase B